MDSLDTAIDIANKVSGGDPLSFLLALIGIAFLIAVVYLWKDSRTVTKEHVVLLQDCHAVSLATSEKYNTVLRELVKSNVGALKGIEHHLSNIGLEVSRTCNDIKEKIETSEQIVNAHVETEVNRIINTLNK